MDSCGWFWVFHFHRFLCFYCFSPTNGQVKLITVHTKNFSNLSVNSPFSSAQIWHVFFLFVSLRVTWNFVLLFIIFFHVFYFINVTTFRIYQKRIHHQAQMASITRRDTSCSSHTSNKKIFFDSLSSFCVNFHFPFAYTFPWKYRILSERVLFFFMKNHLRITKLQQW